MRGRDLQILRDCGDAFLFRVHLKENLTIQPGEIRQIFANRLPAGNGAGDCREGAGHTVSFR
jgi:hypothetical protein